MICHFYIISLISSMRITLDIAMVKKERGPTILLIGMTIWTYIYSTM